MCELFQDTEHTSNLLNDHIFRIYSVKILQHGTATLSFMGHKIWSLVPSNIKSSDTLKKSEQKSRYWRPDTCPCRLFKTHIKGLGYL